MGSRSRGLDCDTFREVFLSFRPRRLVSTSRLRRPPFRRAADSSELCLLGKPYRCGKLLRRACPHDEREPRDHVFDCRPDRLRSPSLVGGDARPRLRKARRPSDGRRRHGRHPVRRLGSRCRGDLRHRRLQRLDRRHPSDDARPILRTLANLHPRHRRWRHPGTKYAISKSRYNGYCVNKADPFGFAPRRCGLQSGRRRSSTSTATAGATQGWMAFESPCRPTPSTRRIAIYELSIWGRGDGRRTRGIAELYLPRDRPAPGRLLPGDGLHACRALLPITGASVRRLVGLPDGRLLLRARRAGFGSPHDFMFLVDTLHQAVIGVLLDWVPCPLSRRTSTASATSTARISTSTPIRGWASTKTGGRSSSTSGATKW